ncbi:SprT-like domain-containing protein [Paenibacillus sp. GP183]|uniref:SprT-like domain-containing protein n=1 Tax=Paenibacillus sp. GP183 TaxID=1882751 RepID=UPI0008961B10|nr:SprT-like domain-containing protein [Paenibacillus sp. GP183]SEB46467.1 SprT-like protein [Paenibacillus sp. GP183]
MNDTTIKLKLSTREVEGLTNLARDIAMKYWGLDFNIPVIINPRLKRSTYGRFIYNKKTPLRIEISGYSIRNLYITEIIDLMKHEVCHYACFIMQKQLSDGSRFFEGELKRINSTSAGLSYKSVRKTRGK